MLVNLGERCEVSVKNIKDSTKQILLFNIDWLQKAEDVMKEIDTDKSGGIDFSEFLIFMATDKNSRKNSDNSEWGEIFDILDKDRTGFICAEDLKKVHIENGCLFSLSLFLSGYGPMFQFGELDG